MEPNQQNQQATKYNQRHEIKNKLTVTRGKVGGGDGEKTGKGQGTCIKDTWTKPKRGRIEGGVWGSGGRKVETTVLEQKLKKKI